MAESQSKMSKVLFYALDLKAFDVFITRYFFSIGQTDKISASNKAIKFLKVKKKKNGVFIVETGRERFQSEKLAPAQDVGRSGSGLAVLLRNPVYRRPYLL